MSDNTKNIIAHYKSDHNKNNNKTNIKNVNKNTIVTKNNIPTTSVSATVQKVNTSNNVNSVIVSTHRQHRPDFNKWNEHFENEVKSIGEACAVYRWMYNDAAGTSENKYYGIGITLISFNALSGVFSFVMSNDLMNPQVALLLVGMISFLLSLGNAISMFLNYAKDELENRRASSDFLNLYQVANKELMLYRKDRQPAKEFLTWITREYSRIQKDSPTLQRSLLHKYQKKYGTLTENNQEVFDNIRTINVVPEDSDSSQSEYLTPNLVSAPPAQPTNSLAITMPTQTIASTIVRTGSDSSTDRASETINDTDIYQLVKHKRIAIPTPLETNKLYEYERSVFNKNKK